MATKKANPPAAENANGDVTIEGPAGWKTKIPLGALLIALGGLAGYAMPSSTAEAAPKEIQFQVEVLGDLAKIRATQIEHGNRLLTIEKQVTELRAK